MHMIQTALRPFAFLFFVALPMLAWAEDITPFLGTYEGNAEIDVDGKIEERDMAARITRKDDGFEVNWTTVIYKTDGRIKETSYSIGFVPSVRENIFGSAMKTNVFGKPEPLDPLNGEPFVWARLEGDTLSVYSLFINELGGYEMQEYHRTLTEGGLDLLFRRLHNGTPKKEIRTFLARTN